MPVPEPEEVMELANELKEARSRVAVLESRWASFFSQAAATTATMVASSPVYLKPRIVKFLEDRPNLAFNMETVARALNANENSVGPYLSDLVKEGKIERRSRGFYAAKAGPDPNDEYERAKEEAYEASRA